MLHLAFIEDSIVWADKDANLAQLQSNLEKISGNTDLVVLPELFTTGFITNDKDEARKLAETNNGYTVNLLGALSRKFQTAIAGSFLATEGDYLYNRAFFITPEGNKYFYDKHHLFRMGGERDVFAAGTGEAPIINYRGWNIKLTVCYDLRFPVFCRNSNNAYDLLLVVANWPKARLHPWQILLQARAIENLCYVCGVNRAGVDPHGIDFGSGSSNCIDYKGNEVTQLHENEAVTSVVIRKDELIEFREKFPTWRDADNFTLE